MQAHNCPKCGAPVKADASACPYCGVGLSPDPAHARAKRAELPPPEIPAGWTVTRDPWHGFYVAHPPGWQVVVTKGQISIREDPPGLTAAVIWPYTIQPPMTARQAALQFQAVARGFNPSFHAWEQGNSAQDSQRITIITRQVRWGVTMQGLYNVLIDGANAIISGYECPQEKLVERSPVLAQVLATFRTTDLMPREIAHEPSEGAYTILYPSGWLFQGGVDRNHIGGSAMMRYSIARDPQGLAAACMPSYQWIYMEGGASWFGNLGGYQVGRFTSAANYCVQTIAPWMQQFQAQFKVEAIVDRPDLVDLAVIELAQAGYPDGSFDMSIAVIETSYTENGVRLRQKSRVGVQRQRSTGNPFMQPAPMWMALLDVYYRAPENEFAQVEPVLSGIIDSMTPNPAWQAGERQLAQNFIANSQADIQRRTRQISQTLSETSDIVANSYWNRQATYDRLSEMRSNATLGVMNVASSSGEEYKVPTGFDRYWVDGLGNLYGGSWLSQPDLNWKPLEPTGL